MSSRSDGYRGVVVEQLPDALFAVWLDDTNRRVVAHVDGSSRRNFVRLLPGDRVTVELTSQNRTRRRDHTSDRYGDALSAGEPV